MRKLKQISDMAKARREESLPASAAPERHPNVHGIIADNKTRTYRLSGRGADEIAQPIVDRLILQDLAPNPFRTTRKSEELRI